MWMTFVEYCNLRCRAATDAFASGQLALSVSSYESWMNILVAECSQSSKTETEVPEI